MNYINNMYLLGNLTRDPEIKYTNEGTAIAEIGPGAILPRTVQLH